VLIGNIADYKLALQENSSGVYDLMLYNIQSGSGNVLRNVELAQIGGDFYIALDNMPTLTLDEQMPLADFVRVIGVNELTGLGVPGSWML